MRVQLGLLSLTVTLVTLVAGDGQDCKCGPNDACWPSKRDWDRLNSTVNGRLIKTVPIGAVCHDSYDGQPTYDAAACTQLQATWGIVDPHLPSSSSVMQQLWANASCDPFDPRQMACEIGDYVQYAINVTTQQHVLDGLKFVQDHHIRLVIRNTGHDDLGRSTGYGSMGIWLHHVTDIQYLPSFQNSIYSGPAVKVMAGDSSGDMLAELTRHGMMAVGGACPTVAVAGGYTPGGGHSPLSSLHGLSADNTLELEVITANGRVVTASPSENRDLFWALRGGGAGSFGIVWSLTTKAFPQIPVSAATLTFTMGNHTEDDFFKAIKVYHSIIPNITSAGAYTYTYYYAAGGFTLYPLFGANLTIPQIRAILAPFVDALDSLGFSYEYHTSSYDTYYEAYNGAFQTWPVGGLFGSRLIPRHTIVNNPDGLLSTTREIFDQGGVVVQITFNPNTQVAGNPDNAVLPAWRPSDIHLITGLGWLNGAKNYPLMVQNQSKITNTYIPELKKLVPNSGSYMNEADGFEPDWQNDFFGVNYPRLLSIKQKWDPNTLFWCDRAVGSEALSENSEQILCRT